MRDFSENQFGLKLEAIVRVAHKHVKMYEQRLESKHPIVNVQETTMYRDIWKGVVDQGGKNLDLSQLNELRDALQDGGYFTDEDYKTL